MYSCKIKKNNKNTCYTWGVSNTIALFTVNFSHLHYNIFKRGCEAISGKKCKIARNCLISTFKDIVMEMSNGNREKGYCCTIPPAIRRTDPGRLDSRLRLTSATKFSVDGLYYRLFQAISLWRVTKKRRAKEKSGAREKKIRGASLPSHRPQRRAPLFAAPHNLNIWNSCLRPFPVCFDSFQIYHFK